MNGWRLRSVAVLLAVATGVGLDGIGAQEPYRNGFWMEFGTGAGASRTACGGCEEVTLAYGSSSVLRFGGTLSPRVLLGVEVFALHSAEARLAPGVEPLDAENAMLAPIVLWYVGDSGFFLKGGAGLARGTFTVVTPSEEPTITKRLGSGLTFGLGFDVVLVDRLALTANLGTCVMTVGDVGVGDSMVDDVIATAYGVGVGVTLR